MLCACFASLLQERVTQLCSLLVSEVECQLNIGKLKTYVELWWQLFKL